MFVIMYGIHAGHCAPFRSFQIAIIILLDFYQINYRHQAKQKTYNRPYHEQGAIFILQYTLITFILH